MHQHTRDYQWLKTNLLKSLDVSQVEYYLRLIVSGTPPRHIQLDMIGDGNHFSVYRLPAGPEKMPLALSIAKPEFLATKVPTALSKWVKDLQELSAAQAYLVPPVHFVKNEPENIVYVSLFGEGTEKDVAPHWQPLAEHKSKFLSHLKQRGLVLNDYLQIRSLRGIPFVCDFSDLIKIQP